MGPAVSGAAGAVAVDSLAADAAEEDEAASASSVSAVGWPRLRIILRLSQGGLGRFLAFEYRPINHRVDYKAMKQRSEKKETNAIQD